MFIPDWTLLLLGATFIWIIGGIEKRLSDLEHKKIIFPTSSNIEEDDLDDLIEEKD